eukprot:GHRR01003469.1.p2 GENE.GHRR01003469.1~~GHRR01003469.1.p2  ORF type:complete len:157 (+),score=48.90 GHRR01003469.1:525-995(+)
MWQPATGQQECCIAGKLRNSNKAKQAPAPAAVYQLAARITIIAAQRQLMVGCLAAGGESTAYAVPAVGSLIASKAWARCVAIDGGKHCSCFVQITTSMCCCCETLCCAALSRFSICELTVWLAVGFLTGCTFSKACMSPDCIVAGPSTCSFAQSLC